MIPISQDIAPQNEPVTTKTVGQLVRILKRNENMSQLKQGATALGLVGTAIVGGALLTYGSGVIFENLMNGTASGFLPALGTIVSGVGAVSGSVFTAGIAFIAASVGVITGISKMRDAIRMHLQDKLPFEQQPSDLVLQTARLYAQIPETKSYKTQQQQNMDVQNIPIDQQLQEKILTNLQSFRNTSQIQKLTSDIEQILQSEPSSGEPLPLKSRLISLRQSKEAQSNSSNDFPIEDSSVQTLPYSAHLCVTHKML